MPEVRPIIRGIKVKCDARRVVHRSLQPETACLLEMPDQAALTERKPELWSPTCQSQQQGVRALAATIGTEHNRFRPGHEASEIVGDDQRQIRKK
jgi:hypothetical protein